MGVQLCEPGLEMESGAEDLFLPRLMARRASGRRDACEGDNGEDEDGEASDRDDGKRARRRERTETAPSDGKPYRLIMAESSGRWKTRGFSLPGCKEGEGMFAVEQYHEAYLGFWRDATDFNPAEAEVQ